METYIKPTDVHSPKRRWSLITVLFDGGEENDTNNSPNSLAIGRWDNKPVLAMRWNGSGENPIGNPQSRGLPTWFIVPEQYCNEILASEHFKLSNDKISFARNFLELKRVYFVSPCPNPACRYYGGPVLHSFLPNELDAMLSDLERDELKLYHVICDGFWKPGASEKAELVGVLTAARENYLSGGSQCVI